MDKNNNELYHYGIPGMKWGVRRYTRISSTSGEYKQKAKSKLSQIFEKIQKKREDKQHTFEEQRKLKKQADNQQAKHEIIMNTPAKRLSTPEIDNRISRLNKEKQLRDLQRELAPRQKKIGRAIVNDVIANAAKNAATQVLTRALTTLGNNIVDKYVFGGDKGASQQFKVDFKEVKKDMSKDILKDMSKDIPKEKIEVVVGEIIKNPKNITDIENRRAQYNPLQLPFKKKTR